MSNIAVKSSAQQASESTVQDFKDDLGPFVVAAETTRMPMLFTDAKPGHPIIFANDSFLRLSGHDRDELLAQRIDFMLGRRDSADADTQLEGAFAHGSETTPELPFVRKDGAEYWATVFVSPVRDADGVIVQHFVSLVETTRQRQAQKRAQMMIDELNHRVKNTLATVQSIVAQAVRNTSDPRTVREAIESRISALARSHDLLSREKWESAGLRDLVAAALEPFGVTDGRAERFTITGDNIRLPSGPALALGIAFHELATNAVKYGAFSNATGTVAIGWTLEHRSGRKRLCLNWRERHGPPVAQPTRRGFGSRIIEQGIAHELRGDVTLEYLNEGIVCAMDVPLA